MPAPALPGRWHGGSAGSCGELRGAAESCRELVGLVEKVNLDYTPERCGELRGGCGELWEAAGSFGELRGVANLRILVVPIFRIKL